MLLRALLFFQIFYTVYELHFQFPTGIPGINVVNLIFLLVLGAILMSKQDVVRAKPVLRGAILLFFAVLILAYFNAQSTKPPVDSDDVTYLKTAIFYPLLYFMYLRCRQDLKTTRWMIIFVLVVAAVAGVQAIRQGLDYGFGTFVETHRASGPFGTTFAMANRAGVFYAMFLPMFIALAILMRTQARWRFMALGGVAILALAILFTYSRQSYFIALLAAALLFARRHLIFAAIMAVAFISMIDYLPDSVTERVAETRQTDRVGGDQYDVSTESRWKIWHGAMGMLEDNPQGVGLNRFQTRIGAYVPQYANYDAHNFYVLTVCECGVLGLAALMWLIFRMFSLATMLRRNAIDDESRALATGFTVAVLCVVFGNFYGSPFLEGSVMGDFWILCGLLERYVRLKQLEPGNAPTATPTRALLPQVRVTALPLKDRRPVET